VRWFWVVAFLVAALVGFLLFRTRTGTYLLSTGGNIDAAREAGIHVNRIRAESPTPAPGWPVGWPACCSWHAPAAPTQPADLAAAPARSRRWCSRGPPVRREGLGTRSVAGAVLLQSLINGFTLLGISQYYQPSRSAAWCSARVHIRFQK